MNETTEKPRVRYHNGVYYPIAMFDNLSNLVAGLGTQRDKRTHSSFSAGNPIANWVELEGAYLDNWIARQIVNVPVDDGLREWRSFKIDDESKIQEEEKRLGLRKAYKLGRYWARLYGGAAIVMITDQDLEKPLDVTKIKEGSLKRFAVLDRWDIRPVNINYFDPISVDFLLPEYYVVTGGQTRIHSSHLVRCDGEDIPRRMRALNEGWGDSTLRKVFDDLKDVVASKGGIASLILEANVDTIQREGLSNDLASGKENKILERFALAAQMKSLVHTLLLDGSETFERKSVTFAGLAQILDKFMVWISGASDIPMTRLFGVESKSGIGDSGQGSLNNYYDSVASMQEAQFRPELEIIDQVFIRSVFGEMPEGCKFEWNPLYQESGLELAQQDLALAQSEDIRLQQRVLRPSHIAIRMKAEGKYSVAEQDIARLQKMEKEEDLFENEPDPDYEGYTKEGESGEEVENE